MRVAALATAEAVEDLALRVDVEGRRLLLVERAERAERVAGALELEVGTDHVHHVATRPDVLHQSFWNDAAHGG
jgi:hypothetical protein